MFLGSVALIMQACYPPFVTGNGGASYDWLFADNRTHDTVNAGRLLCQAMLTIGLTGILSLWFFKLEEVGDEAIRKEALVNTGQKDDLGKEEFRKSGATKTEPRVDDSPTPTKE